MSISWQPIRSISSRTICTAFWCTRQPAGSHDHRPAPTCRARPARTMSLCESASASAGACFSVGRTSWDWRLIIGAQNATGEAELLGGYRVQPVTEDPRRPLKEPMHRLRLVAALLAALAVAHAVPGA